MLRFHSATIAGVCFCALAASAGATQVWYIDDGETQFTKPNFADGTDAANQDHITDSVSLARLDRFPLFNAAQESFWNVGSPAGTEWAFSDINGNDPFPLGSAGDYASLTFDSFADSLNSEIGNLIVGRPGVLHITAEDIYIDIIFTAWGGSGAAGFSYDRAIIPAPSGALTLTALALGIGARRRRA